MLQFELQLFPTEIEEFRVFDTKIDMPISDLSNDDLATYEAMISLIGDARITILNTPSQNSTIIYRKNMFNVNENMSISDDYVISQVEYDSYSDSEKLIINKFIEMISLL